MRKKIIAANWKMNGNMSFIKMLLTEIKKELSGQQDYVQCIVFPPAIYISLVQESLQNTPIHWGGQNCYFRDTGPFTGEHSAIMYKDFNSRYMLIGHSERRSLFAENEKIVADKFHHVKEHDIIPILCVGETLAERQQGKTEQVLAKQLQAVAEKGVRSFQNCVIAYEPVWAIGTGQTATPEQVQNVHKFIRTLISEYHPEDAANLSICYGGSVNEKNAQSLFTMPDVDGGLIGGASLNARQFVEIVKCIN